MKNIVYTFLVFATLIWAMGCKDKEKQPPTVPQTTVQTVEKTEAVKTKEPKATVRINLDGKALPWGTLDTKLSTNVVLLDNGLQFRLNDTDNRSVLVNLYAPDFFDQIPMRITQQTSALAPEEVYKVKTQSRLEVVVPSERPVQGDAKILYEGHVTLEEYSPLALTVTFQGKGLPLGASKTQLFPMEGKIVLENFEIYDARN
ncbi:hypothetical protein V1387_12990 [Allomuricauda taeanensis]|uniref:hypothetical protein n=1 Tax=Flagellimonas taeanensis TaxID=1005926 RepID=UPI002E7AAFD6|nr:hypothetical protein [Allomuricauda taeanensis]MEE1963604.1 hypothetical protein [Allomuricauda taeanensis]